MKSLSLYLVLITTAVSLILIIGTVQYAESQLLSSGQYMMRGNGFSVSEKSINGVKLDFQISIKKPVSGVTKISLDGGSVSLSNINYLASDNWSGTIIRDGKFFTLTGNAKSSEGDKISLKLFGRLVAQSKESSAYSISGRIEKNGELFKIASGVKIEKVVIKEPVPEKVIETKIPSSNETKIEGKKILLIAKHTGWVDVSYSYRITTKVYEADKNPTSNFDQNYGFIQGAKITVKILGSDGKIVKSFEGLTDNHGYFSDGYRLPDNFKRGTYKVVVTAEKDGSLDTDELILHVDEYNPLT